MLRSDLKKLKLSGLIYKVKSKVVALLTCWFPSCSNTRNKNYRNSRLKVVYYHLVLGNPTLENTTIDNLLIATKCDHWSLKYLTN